MLMEQIERPPVWSDIVIVRLLRRWVAACEAEQDRLASLVELASELGQSPHAAAALDGLLQLTEECLGRPLKAECCCSRRLAADERAVLLMIASAPAPGQPLASRDIPHGLPGALAWAATALRRAMSDDVRGASGQGPAHCPFERQ